jgi:hypothetical protein
VEVIADRKPVKRKTNIIRPDARKRTPVPTGTVELRAPKSPTKPPTKPGAFIFVSAIVSPLIFGVMLILSGNNPLLFLPMIILSGILAGGQMLNYRSNVRKYEAEEEERRENYQTHLKGKEEEIAGRIELQQKILWREFPSVSNLAKWV